MTNFSYIASYEPRRGSPYSAGLDLKCVEVSSARRENILNLHLGIRVMFDTEEERRTHMFILTQRSSFTEKYGLVMANSPGIIDGDYQGEIRMQCYSVSPTSGLIDAAVGCVGEYVAQIIPVKIGTVLTFPTLVESFSTATERREGGFGSTDAE